LWARSTSNVVAGLARRNAAAKSLRLTVPSTIAVRRSFRSISRPLMISWGFPVDRSADLPELSSRKRH
jgi:hypothetical protein